MSWVCRSGRGRRRAVVRQQRSTSVAGPKANGGNGYAAQAMRFIMTLLLASNFSLRTGSGLSRPAHERNDLVGYRSPGSGYASVTNVVKALSTAASKWREYPNIALHSPVSHNAHQQWEKRHGLACLDRVRPHRRHRREIHHAGAGSRWLYHHHSSSVSSVPCSVAGLATQFGLGAMSPALIFAASSSPSSVRSDPALHLSPLPLLT